MPRRLSRPVLLARTQIEKLITELERISHEEWPRLFRLAALT